MTNNLFAAKLISLIKESINPPELPVTFLGNVLSMGKEAAYRRLRGEIPFTFDEIIKIAHRLDVSLDEIADIGKSTSNSKWASADVGNLSFSSSDYKQLFYENAIKFGKIFAEVAEGNNSMIRTAGAVPYTFILRFKQLSLFRHYKSMYLSQNAGRDFHFGKMVLPSELIDLGTAFVENSQKVQRTLFILDRNAFADMANDINYFLHEKLITKSEFHQLKAELLELLTFVEKLAQRGTYDNESGAEVNIYLSDVTIGPTYAHIESDVAVYTINRIYFMDVLVYQNTRICKKQKRWIELLKRYSTLITQTGEKERFEFFSKQREMVENLLLG